jgi:adenylylsulfate kinase-like enzyme
LRSVPDFSRPQGAPRHGSRRLAEHFTGINDLYEVPTAPDLRIDTEEYTPDQSAQQILLKIEGLGYIR